MPAGERFFVDSNVLLYSSDPADPVKQEAAWRWLAALWESGSGSISWQVLHEYYANAARKLKTAPDQARSIVESYALWQPVEPTLGQIRRAWHWIDSAQLSYWDALIVAAAERTGCSRLLSEDFQPQQKFDSVAVVNPFHSPPEAFGLSVTAR